MPAAAQLRMAGTRNQLFTSAVFLPKTTSHFSSLGSFLTTIDPDLDFLLYWSIYFWL